VSGRIIIPVTIKKEGTEEKKTKQRRGKRRICNAYTKTGRAPYSGNVKGGGGKFDGRTQRGKRQKQKRIKTPATRWPPKTV